MTAMAEADGPKLRFGRGRWIDGWNPENTAQWESVGKKIARRNLAWSMFAEFLGFAMLAVWGMVVPRLPDAGFAYNADERFWLIAMPGLFGALMRFSYTFTVPRFGGRNWTITSALLLMIPASGLAWAVTNPDTPFWLMLVIATTAGLGAGNFTSSMVNISFFYPERQKGAALGLNASGGNLGTAWVQFTIPIIVITAAGLSLGSRRSDVHTALPHRRTRGVSLHGQPRRVSIGLEGIASRGGGQEHLDHRLALYRYLWLVHRLCQQLCDAHALGVPGSHRELRLSRCACGCLDPSCRRLDVR